MQTTRTRSFPPRKDRLWTTSRIELQLATGLVSLTSPQITLDFRAKTGREHLKSDTVLHTWVKGYYDQSLAGDLTDEALAFGLGWFPKAMLAANAPPVLTHDGDWQLHDARSLQEGAANNAILRPEFGATIDIESSGMRSCPGANAYDFILVTETQRSPSAGTFGLIVNITTLWGIAS